MPTILAIELATSVPYWALHGAWAIFQAKAQALCQLIGQDIVFNEYIDIIQDTSKM